ncbi:hypothetical protein [Microbulbifer hydrolyticus]|uniref:Membrane protein n=1 Tax=Microbulbifer hydrolyticus TaxID=48074 RepID=A0A6P1T761_9GAMM|nr:hypothetical protein [Microbulbifer hydrolyticus]MBB5213318.1 putative membrane protein [Microbulbifer hydrolyticus]QHQ38598.1 hypothetical protein GTQ55_06090 [Microbulbifer hydrolyticus]
MLKDTPEKDRAYLRVVPAILMLTAVVKKSYDSELWAGIGLVVIFYLLLELVYHWVKIDNWVSSLLIVAVWIWPVYDWSSSFYQDIVSALWPPIVVVFILGRLIGWWLTYSAVRHRSKDA